jgi:hypothetical protein
MTALRMFIEALSYMGLDGSGIDYIVDYESDPDRILVRLYRDSFVIFEFTRDGLFTRYKVETNG